MSQDTKFEFGYVTDARGQRKLIYMDEVHRACVPEHINKRSPKAIRNWAQRVTYVSESQCLHEGR